MTDALRLPTATVDLPSGTIRYVEVGNGPPVLLVHGAPMTSLAFVRVIHGLAGHLRGHGLGHPVHGARPRHWSKRFAKAERAVIPWEEHFPIFASGALVAQVVSDWASRELQ